MFSKLFKAVTFVPFHKAIAFSLLVCITSLIGCETTDYEPLVMKKKLKEMEREILQLKQSIENIKTADSQPSATSAPQPDSVQPVNTLKSSKAVDTERATEKSGLDVPNKTVAPIAESEPRAMTKTGHGDVTTITEAKADTASVAAMSEPELPPTARPTVRSMAQAKAIISGIRKAGGYVTTNSAGDLVRVDFSETRRFQEILPKLSTVSTLKHLAINGLAADSDVIDNLGDFENLERIDLERSKLTSDDLESLKRVPNLKFLQLGRATFADGSFQTLATFPALEQLRCRQSNLIDDDIEPLKELKTLRTLDISSTKITDASVPHLKKLIDLEYLNVRQSGITQTGYEALNDFFGPRGCEVVAP